MFSFNIGSVLLFLVLGLAMTREATAQSSEPTVPKWSEYKARFTKKYQSSAEEIKRKSIYESNKKMVEEWNANPSNTFKLAMNQFSDETTEEITAKRTGLKRTEMSFRPVLANSGNRLTALSIDSYPRQLNYVGTRLVSAVKDQGGCGSCWAFAVGQAVEGQAAKAYTRLILPSEQQLVDCDPGNSGCDGGFFPDAFDYIANGIQNSSTYPYTGSENTCSANSTLNVVYTRAKANRRVAKFGFEFGSYGWIHDTGFGDLNATVYNWTIGALNEIGPLSIGVCTNKLYDSYKTGIFNNNGSRCTNDPNDYNHAVLLVGYNRSSSDPNEHYWLTKNSWNTWWGEQGYMRLKMNAGLIRDPMYPILNIGDSTVTTARSTTTRTTARTTDRTTTRTTATRTTATRTTATRTTSRRTTSGRSTTRAAVQCSDRQSSNVCRALNSLYRWCSNNEYFRTYLCRLTCGQC